MSVLYRELRTLKQFLFHFSRLAFIMQLSVACACLRPICSFLERNITYIDKEVPYKTVQK